MTTTSKFETFEYRWAEHLDRLRGPGRRRAKRGAGSSALLSLLAELPDGAVILDVGCGDSGDRAEAKCNNLIAYGMDLFPPSDSMPWLRNGFVRADASKNWPFADKSIDGVICHAVAALLKPVDRWTLFQEAARVLKPGGLLSMSIYILADGYTIRKEEEDDRVRESGFHRLRRANLYRRCDVLGCPEHPGAGTFAEIQRGVRRIDSNPMFIATAELLIAFIVQGSISDAVSFTGEPEEKFRTLVRSMIHAGILNPVDGSMDLPWLDAYMRDDAKVGNIALICDVLVLNGLARRGHDESGQPIYKTTEC